MAKRAIPVTKDTNILLRIDVKLKAKLVKAATKDGRTLSDWIRRTLEERISKGT